MRRPSPSLIAADLLRFACALGVMAYHLFTQFWRFPSVHQAAALAGVAPPRPIWTEATRYGWVGVELFFVISGFMILRSLGGGDVRLFLRRRLLRLVPAVWVCATVTALFLLGSGEMHDVGARWADSMLFVPWAPTIDPSYWTLGIELSFYLAMATAARAIDVERHCDKVAALLAISSLTYWVILTLACQGKVLMIPRTEQLLLLPHGCFFAIGMMVARMQASGIDRRHLAIGALAGTAGLLEIGQHAAEQAIRLGRPGDASIPVMLVGAGVAMLALAPRLQPLLARTVGTAAARLLGLATYPLYLLHQEVGASIAGWLAHDGVVAEVAIVIAAGCILLVALAIARWIEPAMRILLARCLDAGALLAKPLASRAVG